MSIGEEEYKNKYLRTANVCALWLASNIIVVRLHGHQDR